MQERKTPAQKKVLYQVKADAIAHVLAEVEAINLRGGAMHTINGQKKKCVYRLQVYAADKSEDVTITGVNLMYHPRNDAMQPGASYFEASRRLLRGEVRPRTPESELPLNFKCLQFSKMHGLKGKAEKLAGARGLRADVNIQLHRRAPTTTRALVPTRTRRFDTLIPGGIYTSTAMDVLHVIYIGLVPKWAKMLDALFVGNLRDPEDKVKT